MSKALYNKTMNTFLKYDGALSLVDSVIIEIIAKLKIYKITSFNEDSDKVLRIH